MNTKSVISYSKEKICANCKHVYIEEDTLYTFCNLKKDRPASGYIHSACEIFDYYDSEKYALQCLNFEIWKNENSVFPTHTCASYESYQNETST